jgi:hypothetical protein
MTQMAADKELMNRESEREIAFLHLRNLRHLQLERILLFSLDRLGKREYCECVLT